VSLGRLVAVKMIRTGQLATPTERLRFRTEALAEDLERWLRGEPIEARPAGPLERLGRWGRRNPGWAAMLAVVVGLLLVIAVGSSLLTLRLHGALATSQEQTKQANAQRRRAEGAERQANAELWDAYRAEAQAKRRTHAMGQRLESLAAIRKALALPLTAGPVAGGAARRGRLRTGPARRGDRPRVGGEAPGDPALEL
jgi:serine/threonine-protein kinase